MCELGGLTGPVTFPLSETLAINLLHVGGEGGNNCCIAERVLLIGGKVSRVSHSEHLL